MKEFKLSGFEGAICNECKDNDCSFVMDGVRYPCPYAETTKEGKKICNTEQSSFEVNRELFEVIVMHRKYGADFYSRLHEDLPLGQHPLNWHPNSQGI